MLLLYFQIDELYPNSTVTLQLVSTVEPYLEIKNGQISMHIKGDIGIYAVEKNSSMAYLLTLNLVCCF